MKFFVTIALCTIQLFSVAQVTDYNIIYNWASHPQKWDFADSTPKGVKKLETPSLKNNVNVFFIHPTSYTQTNAWQQSWNASVTDSALNQSTDKRTILFQASCFNYGSNLYAPRYRQAHYNAFISADPAGKAALDTAYNDIRNAFLYFLKNADTSLPFIIAAHSQGTVHGGRLIKEFVEAKHLQKKLVCAYLIGMPINKNYFATLKPCGNANETGCFVSWRSYLKGFEGEPYLQKETPNSVYVTNPLSWKNDTILVDRKQNNGAVLLKFNSLVKNISGTQVYNNILWITKPKFFGSFLVKNKRTNYHIGDINLFYQNIRQNMKDRIQSFELQR